MVKVVELFAGVGGFRVGLERASNEFETIWANQWEPGKKVQHAYNCYISHYGEDSCINEDIAKVKFDVPNHDLLVGGFPCQDYSVASTGAKGIEGKKGVLWWEIRDIVEHKRPKYILLENVDRLIKSPSSQRGRDFAIILKSLNDLGYMVEWKVVNAAEYGCVQRRRRVFIFAYHSSTNFYAENSKIDFKDLVLNKGFFSDVFVSSNVKEERQNSFDFSELDLVQITEHYASKFWNSGVSLNGKGFSIETVPTNPCWRNLGDIIEKDEVDSSYFLTENQTKKFEYLRGGKKIERIRPNGEPYFYAEGAMSPYDYLDSPSRTMLTSESSVNRSTHIVKDIKTGNLRFLTQVECERLNGFPDNWTKGSMPEKFRYFCMGNALVTNLIEMMGKKIARIDGDKQGMNDCNIKDLIKLVQDFCEARDWDQFHNPKELAIGMSTESNELLDIFRFKSIEQMQEQLNSAKREDIEDELSDVFFFVLRFAQMYDIDLEKTLKHKVAKNNAKYPVDKFKGSNKKYDE